MDKVRFPYRSAGHLALLNIVAESGSWKRQGLSVDYNFYVGPQEAHDLLRSGKVEFISGNHITPYIARATGDDWIYLAQAAIYIRHALVLKKGSKVRSLKDLKGKSLAVDGKGGPHMWLNSWLMLKQNGLDSTVELKRVYTKVPLWQAVQAGEIETGFVNLPDDLKARREGLRTVLLPLLPMVVWTTVSTTGKFVKQNGKLIKRFLKGLGDGIRFLKKEKKKAVEILNATLPKERGGGDKEMVEYTYKEMTEVLTENLYPTMEAIANVYAEACRYDAVAKKVNPLELWDLHFLRELRDDGKL